MAVQMTQTDVNKALVRRAIAYNHGVAGAAEEIFAPDFVAHMPGRPPLDRAGLDHFIGAVTSGIPGLTFEIDDQVAQGDRVYNRIAVRGVHSGEIKGVPATGRTVEIRGLNSFRVKDGRVVEQWAQLDLFGLLQQIGAIPT